MWDGPRSQGEPVSDAKELRAVLRAYKRAASLLRDVLQGPTQELEIAFRFTAGIDRPTSGEFSAGVGVDRHAVLLRPFMDPSSPIELRAVWTRLLALGCVGAPRVAEVEAAFAASEALAFPVAVNGENLSARDVYFAYGEGEYFREDEDARARLVAMSVGPMPQLVQLLFHDACAGFSAVVFAVLYALLECEGQLPECAEAGPGLRTCIYCRGSDGDFGTEEHVIPESLGGDAMVIRNCVCAACNNRLSTLDKALLDFEPLAMLRAVFGPMTKKGKFPKARLRDIDIERTAPRHVRITQKTGKPLPAPAPEEDGSVRFTVTGTGTKPADPVLLGRALFKIALGLVAHDAGPAAALDSRYDAARAFVMTGAPFATHLVMVPTAKPHGQIRTWWQPSAEGTLVALNLFGLELGFSLEPSPVRIPDEVDGVRILSFWLGERQDSRGAADSDGPNDRASGEG